MRLLVVFRDPKMVKYHQTITYIYMIFAYLMSSMHIPSTPISFLLYRKVFALFFIKLPCA